MEIAKLNFKDFRNYGNLTLELNPKVNIFIGDNAQGKTNLLEGIYLSSLGKSFRTSKDTEMIRFEAPFFRVEVTALKDGERLTVEIALSEDQKAIKIDGVKALKSSELLQHIYTVIFSPEDLKIVKDEPEKRRRFIDREISLLKPSYLRNLASYKKALAQRNALLKEKKVKDDALEVWDKSLSNYAEPIITDREEYVKKLEEISRKIHYDLSEGKEDLRIIYERGVEGNLYEALKHSIRIDRLRGTTTKGPHRDDLKLLVNGKDLRSFGSQGQQRTAALALKLSELKLIKEETKEEGILLLDDVLSELDSRRQKYLINTLKDVQVFITSAELSEELKSMLSKGNVYKVTQGEVVLQND